MPNLTFLVINNNSFRCACACADTCARMHAHVYTHSLLIAINSQVHALFTGFSCSRLLAVFC